MPVNSDTFTFCSLHIWREIRKEIGELGAGVLVKFSLLIFCGQGGVE